MNEGKKFFCLFKMPAFREGLLASLSIWGFQVKHASSITAKKLKLDTFSISVLFIFNVGVICDIFIW